MSGFVAPTRAVQARPRLSRIDRQAFAFDARPAAPGEAPAELEVVDRTGVVSLRRDALAERLQAIRERWAQATFYLFDGNSWR